MVVLVVKNWEKFQHYNKRNPPWIKLHRSILTDHKLTKLSYASRLLASLLWLLASEKNGEIEYDIEMISFRVNMTETVTTKSLKELMDSGFFTLKNYDASNLHSTLTKSSHSVSVSESVSDSEIGGMGEREITSGRKLAIAFLDALKSAHKPALEELETEFDEMLRVHGQDKVQVILAEINNPKRRKTEANSIGKLFEFWNHFDFIKPQASKNGKHEKSPHYEYTPEMVEALRTKK